MTIDSNALETFFRDVIAAAEKALALTETKTPQAAAIDATPASMEQDEQNKLKDFIKKAERKPTAFINEGAIAKGPEPEKIDTRDDKTFAATAETALQHAEEDIVKAEEALKSIEQPKEAMTPPPSFKAPEPAPQTHQAPPPMAEEHDPTVIKHEDRITKQDFQKMYNDAWAGIWGKSGGNMEKARADLADWVAENKARHPYLFPEEHGASPNVIAA